jgi:hypothetical protein
VVVVAVNDVDSTDGGCAGVVSGGDGGLVGVSSLGAVCVTALAVEVVVICIAMSTVEVVAVWVAKSVVSGLAWVPALKAMFQMSEK